MSEGLLATLAKSDAISEHARERVIAELSRREQASTIQHRREQPHEIPPSSDAQTLVAHEPAVLQPEMPELSSVRSEGDSSLPPLAPIPDLPGGRWSTPEARDVAGPTGRHEGLRPDELHLDNAARTDTPAELYRSHKPSAVDPGSGFNRRSSPDALQPAETQRATLDKSAPVLDAQRPDITPERMGEADRGNDPLTESATTAGDTAGTGATGEGSPRLTVPVLLARKPIDQYSAKALETFLRGNTLSESARGKIETELASRKLSAAPGAAYAPFVNDATLPASKAATAADTGIPTEQDPAEVIDDLNSQIDNLRNKLENAYDPE